MLELLNQLDGFDSRGDVKVILATNKIESLDPALLRPGRIDRKIEFPLLDSKTRRRIFQALLSVICLFDSALYFQFKWADQQVPAREKSGRKKTPSKGLLFYISSSSH